MAAMLEQWRRVQRDLWELDAETQHLGTSVKSAVDRLARTRLYHAELSCALRNLRRVGNSAGGNASESMPRGAGSSSVGSGLNFQEVLCKGVDMEEVFGYDVAQAWINFLRALMAKPRTVPGVAQAVGYQGHEVLAQLVVSLIEDPIEADLRGGKVTAKALDEVLGCEFDALRLGSEFEGSAVPEATKIFRDGSFLNVLMQTLTQATPACMTWARNVLSQEVREAVQRLVRTVPTRRAERAATTGNLARPSLGGAQASAAKPQPLHEFIDEPANSKLSGPLASPMRTQSSETPPGASSDADSLCETAKTVVSSLCACASMAPPQLCRVTAALCRQLEKHYASDAIGAPENSAAKAAARHALLGCLLLDRWLVPWMLAPGFSFVLQAEPPARAALTDLAKLLKSIASGAQDGSQSLYAIGVNPEFVREQAERLRKGLFDVLESRGTSPQGSVVDDITLPRCFMANTADFSMLRRTVAAPGVAAKVAKCVGLPVETLQALNSAPTDNLAPIVVVWLQRGHSEKSARLEDDRKDSMDVLTQSFGAVRNPLLEALLVPVTSLSQSGEDVKGVEMTGGYPVPSLFQVDEGADSLVCAPPVETVDAQGTRSGANTAASSSAAGAQSDSQDGVDADFGVELLAQVLREPRPLDGSPETPLASALSAWGVQDMRTALPQQLRLEMLMEVLQPRSRSNGSAASNHAKARADSAAVEARLLQAISKTIAGHRSSIVSMRRVLLQLQLAQRLAGQHCLDMGQALKHSARMIVEYRWESCLRTLWSSGSSGAPRGGGSFPPADASNNSGPTPLELCIVGPPLELVRQQPQLLSQRRRNGGSDVRVQMFDKTRCPCHRVAAVGATMGFGHLQLEGGVKHWSFRGLRQAVRELQHLPLETAVQNGDPFGIIPALHLIIDNTANSVAQHCRLEITPPDRFGSSLSGSPHAEVNGAEEWTRPADLMEVDESHIRECVVRQVFAYLHTRLFPHNRDTPHAPCPTDADLHTSAQIARLSWLQPRHLDVPESLVETPEVDRAIRALRRLHTLRSPAEMLAALSRTFRTVTEAACIRAQMQTGGGDAFGADSAFPLFIITVLRANPPMFNSVLAYSEIFSVKAQMLTDQGYALTQAQAAHSFVENLQERNLMCLEPGDWERHMRQR